MKIHLFIKKLVEKTGRRVRHLLDSRQGQDGGRALSITSHRVQVGRVPIYYQVTGTGPPLILVHGLAGSSRWWKHNIAALAAHFRVYIIDLVGFGESGGEHPFVLDEASAYITKWMDVVGLNKASFIGHSMGGFIVADLAADYPEHVDHLVLVDAAGLPFNMNYLQNVLGLVRSLRYVPFRFFPVLLTDALRAGPVTLKNALREILHSDLTEKLDRIRAPTLVVWGEHDQVVPLSLGREFAAHIQKLHFSVVPGAGHNPMWDRPEIFNRVVLAFLSAPRAEAAERQHGNEPRIDRSKS